MQKLLHLAQHNCWGQADALFAVCMAEVGKAETAGFAAAKKCAAVGNTFAIQFRLQCLDSTMPSVHAWVAVNTDPNDSVFICQAMQSKELALHVTQTLPRVTFTSQVEALCKQIGRRRRMSWASIRSSVEALCGMELGDCFTNDSQILVQVFSVAKR